MQALAWRVKGSIRREPVPDPQFEHPRDMIIRVASRGIRGSDPHIRAGVTPTMPQGDITGILPN